ncbi:MAG: hypothetical protein MUC29_07160 [Pyrinomonadaceae bacterium]|nr:hypothetical protein [Pyrinomonadaceae bacterium]
MKKLILMCILGLFTLNLQAQTTSNHKTQEEAKQNAGKGVTFKIPEGVIPMDWNKNGFKGLLLLAKKDPTGIFLAYPNDNENIEDLKSRVKKTIVPMFIHDDKNVEKSEWKSLEMPLRQGDKNATYWLYQSENQIQILLYEKEWQGLTLIYGYFAMKSKNASEKDLKKIWANEKGEGVKLFDKFLKDFAK